MPELPDVTVYVEALEARVRDKRLERVKLLNPFILRTAVPPIGEAEGKRVVAARRIGKRIVLALEGPLYLVLHLMIAGRLRWLEAAGGFPEKVTAFRDGMAVHGRYGEPCPTCGAPIQRIVFAENETNYCARCQTGGKILADRALSRLLKKSWPRSIDELQ